MQHRKTQSDWLREYGRLYEEALTTPVPQLAEKYGVSRARIYKLINNIGKAGRKGYLDRPGLLHDERKPMMLRGNKPIA